ncbi:hypothetical protein [Streptomyces sp. NPDC002676]
MTAEELVAAVRRGDTDAVRDLLRGGADPDTLVPGEDVPVLCLAVAAYDHKVAEALTEAGADALRPLPDGTTPLLRAIDGGDRDTVDEVLPPAERMAEDARREALARARHWADTGVEAELRRRSGARGPVRREVVESRWGASHSVQLALGGLTARDAHLGILCELERWHGVRVPFEELLGRALARQDPDHADWFAAANVLGGRQENDETWQAAVALSRHPEALHRLFAADVLLFLGIGSGLDGRTPFDDLGTEAFLPWARAERDPRVLAAVLNGLAHQDDAPEIEDVGLSYRAHPDPRVRALVPDILERGEGGLLVRPARLAAVLGLARDPDPLVRRSACMWLAEYPGRDPELRDALAALTDEDDPATRVYAMYGLANKDDPRCVEASRRIEAADGEPWGDDWMLDAARRYEERRAKAAGAGAAG